MAIHVFGLTGGIGSGKSLVADRFRARGLPVADADALAREVVAPGSDGLAQIVSTFGEQVLGPDGTLDRPRVAALVFSDELARSKLNAITHTRVRALARERFDRLDAGGEPLACYEVPLLFENGLARIFQPVVVVQAPESLCVARAVARGGATEEDIRARLRAQMPLAEKASLAHHVIDNAGTIEATLAQADQILDTVARACSVDAARYPTG